MFLCLQQCQAFPQACAVTWLLLNIWLKCSKYRKTKLLEGENKPFVLTCLTKVREKHDAYFVDVYEAALRRTKQSCKYTRNSVFIVLMHSHVFLRGYWRHGEALRGEIHGSSISSESNCPLKARHQSRWGYKFSQASVNIWIWFFGSSLSF